MSTRGNYIRKKTNLSNQPAVDPHVAEAMSLVSKAITKAKAVTFLKLLPHLRKQYQTVRKLAEILHVSHTTVHNWIREYGNHTLHQTKGGDNHEKNP